MVAEAKERSGGYGRGVSILSVGVAATGIVTFAYFSLASHSLSEVDYKGVSLLWSVLFLIISIIYRPVEQLLSHTIASRRAQGHEGHPLRVALTIQGVAAATFLVIALALRDRLERDVFDGSSALYWVLVVAVVAYAASYFARGWLAGHKWFGLYGGLVLLESVSRCLFPLAVALGIASGQAAVAMGIAAAPLVSLAVVPWALERGGARRAAASEPGAMREGAGFAGAVLAIMVAEQALLNGPVLVVDATSSNAVLAGFVFNVLLITRAPLQLFQAIQTSLLPHLSGLHATGEAGDFRRAIRITVLVIGSFAAAVVITLGAIGPWAMGVLFGGSFDYDRVGLMLVGLGMGFHLSAATLNQAALARRRGGQAAAAWLAAAALFMLWLIPSPLGDPVLDVEVGYCATAALLAVALWLIERTSAPAPAAS